MFQYHTFCFLNSVIYLYRTITPDEKYGQLFVFSLRLALWMQIIGFSVRFLSSFIWIQMYRLGASSSSPTYFDANHEVRNSFLSPRSDSVRRSSMADDILGGSIYDPSYYSSLFEDFRNNPCNHQVPSSLCYSSVLSSLDGLDLLSKAQVAKYLCQICVCCYPNKSVFSSCLLLILASIN